MIFHFQINQPLNQVYRVTGTAYNSKGEAQDLTPADFTSRQHALDWCNGHKDEGDTVQITDNSEAVKLHQYTVVVLDARDQRVTVELVSAPDPTTASAVAETNAAEGKPELLEYFRALVVFVGHHIDTTLWGWNSKPGIKCAGGSSLADAQVTMDVSEHTNETIEQVFQGPTPAADQWLKLIADNTADISSDLRRIGLWIVVLTGLLGSLLITYATRF